MSIKWICLGGKKKLITPNRPGWANFNWYLKFCYRYGIFGRKVSLIRFNCYSIELRGDWERFTIVFGLGLEKCT
jgi:hypothetical protein